jgi:hypothetical protein
MGCGQEVAVVTRPARQLKSLLEGEEDMCDGVFGYRQGVGLPGDTVPQQRLSEGFTEPAA